MGIFVSYGYISPEEKATLLSMAPITPPPPGPIEIPVYVPPPPNPPPENPDPVKRRYPIRKPRPPFRVPDDHPGFVEHGIQVVVMKEVGVESVDKKLKESSTMYNAHVRRWFDLHRFSNQMATMTPKHLTKGDIKAHYQYVLEEIAKKPHTRGTMSVKYVSEYVLELLYDDQNSTIIAIPPILAFNYSMKLIEEIISKEVGVRDALELFLKTADSLLQEVLDAKNEDEHEEAAGVCVDNLRQLRRSIPTFKVIHQEAVRHFHIFKEGVSVLPLWYGCENDPNLDPNDFYDPLEGTIARTGHPFFKGPRYRKLRPTPTKEEKEERARLIAEVTKAHEEADKLQEEAEKLQEEAEKLQEEAEKLQEEEPKPPEEAQKPPEQMPK